MLSKRKFLSTCLALVGSISFINAAAYDEYDEFETTVTQQDNAYEQRERQIALNLSRVLQQLERNIQNDTMVIAQLENNITRMIRSSHPSQRMEFQSLLQQIGQLKRTILENRRHVDMSQQQTRALNNTISKEMMMGNPMSGFNMSDPRMNAVVSDYSNNRNFGGSNNRYGATNYGRSSINMPYGNSYADGRYSRDSGIDFAQYDYDR